MTLIELAERVESLSGPDKGIDADIGAAMHSLGWHAADCLASFTASLDAATSVFPAETMYRSGHSALAPDPSMFFCDAVLPDGTDVHSLALTEPNARLAAALRARAAMETQ